MTDQDNGKIKKVSRGELDDFWDIDKLLPDSAARRPSPRPARAPGATAAVDIEVPPPARARAESAPSDGVETPAGGDNRHTVSGSALTAGTHYVPPHADEERSGREPLSDYCPGGVLIHRVKVHAWNSNFHYFDQFAKDAVFYDGLESPQSARPEGFFSYFPQYVQLGRRQAAWYLYWRGRVRAGVYPDTDYAYILLYIFELINLPVEDEATAASRRDLMAATWVAYRRTYPQLDRYMCEWLCDYCLIHALPAPVDVLSPALDAIIEGSRLKEFYLQAVVGGEGHETETARILMRHCCQYDYRKSKFASGEHKALFDRIIPTAIAAVLPHLLGAGGQRPLVTMLPSTVTRDAYTGALCSYQNKRRIEVSYTSFSRSHELRFLIGDMVKHVENRLRGWIGVRSRLSVMSLPIPLRDALDAYLAPLTPAKPVAASSKKETARPAYEALYDLPRKAVSLADVAAIEAASWETTRILTEAFGGEEEPTSPATPMPPPASTVTPSEAASLAERQTEIPPLSVDIPDEAVSDQADTTGETPLAAALASYLPFVRAALARDRAAQRAFAASVSKMPDAIADEINAITTETVILDMILEDDGTGLYTVIDDYRHEVVSLCDL